MRIVVRTAFLALLALQTIAPLQAQTNGSDSPLPPWIVLALRVEAEDNLVPTTGVVIDSSGLVLVSSEFTAGKGDLIVLDGGTDLGRHGRPAKVVRTSNVDGLAVLAVENLRRTPPQLAAAVPALGDPLRLLAYPPAQELGAGKPPLLIDRQFEVDPSGRPSFRGAALPNVPGALVNACGQLVAISQPSGAPSMSSTPPARYLWTRDIGKGVSTLQVRLMEAPCNPAPAPTTVVATTQNSPQSSQAPPTAAASTPSSTNLALSQAPAEMASAKESSSNSNPPMSKRSSKATKQSDSPSPTETPGATDKKTEAKPTSVDLSRLQEALRALGLFQGAADGQVSEPLAQAIDAYRQQHATTLDPTAYAELANAAETTVRAQSSVPATSAPTTPAAALPTVADEPLPWWRERRIWWIAAGGAGLLVLALVLWRVLRRQQPPAERIEPGVSVTAELLLEAQLSDGRTLRKAIPCVRGVYDAVVGRSDSDVEIPLDTISRRHAQFVGRRGALMLVDLGSSNGTAVNRVPLVRHERTLVHVGDAIDFGGTVFKLLEA